MQNQNLREDQALGKSVSVYFNLTVSEMAVTYPQEMQGER